MIKDIFISLTFVALTVLIYALSVKMNKKFKIAALNPIMLSAILIILFLSIFKIPYSSYNMGGKVIASGLGPIVVVLAIPLYNNRDELMKHFIPIICGVTASVLTSFGTVMAISKLFNIDTTIVLSLLSKSITTPMAVESTKLLGGNEAVTIAAVVITGLIGSAIAPVVMRIGKIKNNIAKGIGIGSASHAMGTAKAVEMNEEVGAASGLAIGVTGLLTIIVIIIFA
ncbi:MAG: LrgB family protein [Sedimentibacter sp.]|uniref:LrgB family protein n=1 Tax=Sedimentibacter sp. TaxID=1960295 RepID=UPI002980FC01|nr:LrgB family protein [Sedimentibacter sp.]MDW5299935.1 LrgB family protein [Sedimentibacter sp.]